MPSHRDETREERHKRRERRREREEREKRSRSPSSDRHKKDKRRHDRSASPSASSNRSRDRSSSPGAPRSLDSTSILDQVGNSSVDDNSTMTLLQSYIGSIGLMRLANMTSRVDGLDVNVVDLAAKAGKASTLVFLVRDKSLMPTRAAFWLACSYLRANVVDALLALAAAAGVNSPIYKAILESVNLRGSHNNNIMHMVMIEYLKNPTAESEMACCAIIERLNIIGQVQLAVSPNSQHESPIFGLFATIGRRPVMPTMKTTVELTLCQALYAHKIAIPNDAVFAMFGGSAGHGWDSAVRLAHAFCTGVCARGNFTAGSTVVSLIKEQGRDSPQRTLLSYVLCTLDRDLSGRSEAVQVVIQCLVERVAHEISVPGMTSYPSLSAYLNTPDTAGRTALLSAFAKVRVGDDNLQNRIATYLASKGAKNTPDFTSLQPQSAIYGIAGGASSSASMSGLSGDLVSQIQKAIKSQEGVGVMADEVLPEEIKQWKDMAAYGRWATKFTVVDLSFLQALGVDFDATHLAGGAVNAVGSLADGVTSRLRYFARDASGATPGAGRDWKKTRVHQASAYVLENKTFKRAGAGAEEACEEVLELVLPFNREKDQLKLVTEDKSCLKAETYYLCWGIYENGKGKDNIAKADKVIDDNANGAADGADDGAGAEASADGAASPAKSKIRSVLESIYGFLRSIPLIGTVVALVTSVVKVAFAVVRTIVSFAGKFFGWLANNKAMLGFIVAAALFAYFTLPYLIGYLELSRAEGSILSAVRGEGGQLVAAIAGVAKAAINWLAPKVFESFGILLGILKGLVCAIGPTNIVNTMVTGTIVGKMNGAILKRVASVLSFVMVRVIFWYFSITLRDGFCSSVAADVPTGEKVLAFYKGDTKYETDVSKALIVYNDGATNNQLTVANADDPIVGYVIAAHNGTVEGGQKLTGADNADILVKNGANMIFGACSVFLGRWYQNQSAA